MLSQVMPLPDEVHYNTSFRLQPRSCYKWVPFVPKTNAIFEGPTFQLWWEVNWQQFGNGCRRKTKTVNTIKTLVKFTDIGADYLKKIIWGCKWKFKTHLVFLFYLNICLPSSSFKWRQQVSANHRAWMCLLISVENWQKRIRK